MSRRTLVGTVGYRNLRDHSAGFVVLERLEQEDLGPDVVVEDASYNPIALVQWLQGEPPATAWTGQEIASPCFLFAWKPASSRLP